MPSSRKSPLPDPNGGSHYYIGFDLGGTKMVAVLYDADLKRLARKKMPTEGFEGAKAGMKRIAGLIEWVLKDAGLKAKELAGIGIGCPGVVNPERGVLYHAPNLGWNDVSVGPSLEKTFGCPVAVMNDVDAGIYGEYLFGAAKGSRSALGVFPGTGIGAGFIHEGRPFTGRSTSCMEIGNLRLFTTNLASPRDEPVSLESLASRLAVSSAAVVEAYKGNAPYLMANSGTDIRAVKSGALLAAAENGDEAISRIVDNAVYYLGVGIAGVVDLLAPDIVVLGGGLVQKMQSLFLKGVTDTVRRISSPEITADMKIVAAKLGDDAAVLGTAAFARERHLNPSDFRPS